MHPSEWSYTESLIILDNNEKSNTREQIVQHGYKLKSKGP